jgi:hypothetical protein
MAPTVRPDGAVTRTVGQTARPCERATPQLDETRWEHIPWWWTQARPRPWCVEETAQVAHGMRQDVMICTEGLGYGRVVGGDWCGREKCR